MVLLNHLISKLVQHMLVFLIIDLQCESNGMSARLSADSEAFLPCGGMLASMSVGGTGGAPLDERSVSNSKGSLSPGKAVTTIYEQVSCCYHGVVEVPGLIILVLYRPSALFVFYMWN